MHFSRREFVATVGVVGLAGCTGGGGPDVELEYSIAAGTDLDSIPEDIRQPRSEGGKRKEGYQWVAVEFTVADGTLDMEDMWFRSRVETSDRYYDLDHATDDLRDGVQSRGDIQVGGEGIALYQIPDDEDTYSWNLEDMQQDISAEKVGGEY